MPEGEDDPLAGLTSPTTNWTSGENWMHQAGSTEEERKQQLLSTGALSPDSIRSADSDVTRDMNARLAGACRLGDKEMAAQLIQQGAQINAVSGEVCPLVVAAAADEVGFGSVSKAQCSATLHRWGLTGRAVAGGVRRAAAGDERYHRHRGVAPGSGRLADPAAHSAETQC